MPKLFPDALRLLAGALAIAAGGVQAAVPIQHWTLSNGAKVYLASVDALPILDVQVDFDAGNRRDPAAQAGLAGVTAGMIEKGVRADDSARAAAPAAASYAAAMDENALGEAWADLGAAFDASAGTERLSFTLRTLSEPALRDRAVELASRLIGQPSFPEPVWLRERERIGAAIREADTKPATVAGKTFARLVYGAHPYGSETTAESGIL